MTEGEFRFKCQRTGNCCSNPSIIVTLTYMDIIRLYKRINTNFSRLIRLIVFYRIDDMGMVDLSRLVVKPITTSEGLVVPALKKDNGVCTFYFNRSCTIYPDRPLACQNYPFSFYKEDNEIHITYVKDSRRFCPGINQGLIISTQELLKKGKRFFNILEKHNQIVDEINKEAEVGRPLSAREAVYILLSVASQQEEQLQE